jgi:hypothetical protein
MHAGKDDEVFFVLAPYIFKAKLLDCRRVKLHGICLINFVFVQVPLSSSSIMKINLMDPQMMMGRKISTVQHNNVER